MTTGFPSDAIDQLLSLDSIADQTEWLTDRELTSADSLTELLDLAQSHIRINIDEATRLSDLGATVSQQENLTGNQAHFLYQRAQCGAMQADFLTALPLIEQAKNLHETAGDSVSAWRTTVGLMRVLGELGQYETALIRSDETLSQITDSGNSHPQLEIFIYQNRGICNHHLGRTFDAWEDYVAIETRADALTDDARADLSINKGLILIDLGRFSEAQTEFSAAVSSYSTLGNPLREAKATLDLAYTQLRSGQYGNILNLFTTSRDLFRDSGAIRDALIAQNDLAEAYIVLNQPQHALSLYDEAIEDLRQNHMRYELGRALRGAGNCLAMLGNVDLAAERLQEALSLFDLLNARAQIADTLIDYSAILETIGRTDEASSTARTGIESADTNGLATQSVLGRFRLFDLLTSEGKHDDARLVLDAIDADIAEIAPLRYRLLYRRGISDKAAGNTDSAETNLLTAIETIEQLRAVLPQEQIRSAFLQDKIAPFSALTSIYLDQNTPESSQKAFLITERAKARTLHEMMLGEIEQRLETTGEEKSIPEATRTNLTQLQTDLNAAYNQLLETNAPEDDARSIGFRQKIYERVQNIEREINRIRLEINAKIEKSTAETTFYQNLVALPTQIPADIPLIAYHTIDEELIAFVHHAGNIHVIRNLTTLPTIIALRDKLLTHWNRLKAGRTFATRHLAQLERSAQRILHDLYQALFAKIQPHLPDHHQLMIIPQGILHQIPIHALHNGTHYLTEQYEIAYAPSVMVYAHCARQSLPSLSNTTLFGVSDPDLVGVKSEIDTLQDTLTNSTTYLDEDATRSAFHEAIDGADALHIATHGIFRSENPTFSGFRLVDGWLTAYDISQLTHTPPLVTFSSCESGRHTVISGDETIGLSRAFLQNGTHRLLVSQWQIQDELAARFMPRWYQNVLNGINPVNALRKIQLDLKKEISHPYYWASTMFIGAF